MRFLKRSIYFLFSIIILLSTFIIFSFSKPDKESDLEHQFSFEKDYSVYALNLPEELTFAGEKVPINNFDVREALDQELLINTYWQSHTLLLIKRANRYFPQIEKILKEEGVPEDFKYLALAESDLLNLVSPAGAVGIWQITKSTASDYRLEVNREVDERYHFEKATRTACTFLKKAKEKFGTWTMAAGAYNVGRTGILKQINRQKEESYYDLLLNTETGRYVYRLLALKIILENPKKYGFNYRAKDLYYPIPYYEVKVDTAVKSFATFAKQHNTNYKMLKFLNPWLRESYLTNSRKKEYTIKIPKDNYRDFNKIIEYNMIDSLTSKIPTESEEARR